MKLFAFLVFLLLASTVFSQIVYQPVSFTEALTRAGAESKLIFLQFESKDCNQCNEVGDKGLNDQELSALINQTFLPIKITAQHPDRSLVESRYNLSKKFGSLFIESSGTLIHIIPSTASMPRTYFKEVDIALNKAGESLKVSALEKEYKSGNRSPGFIEALLLKKRTLNLPTQVLLDEYVSLLPADSLQSSRTLVFIAQMAPLINTKSDTALRRNLSAFNKAWGEMPYNIRVSANNRIIYGSMNKAIAAKDEGYAIRTASFAQRTNSQNYAAGAKAFDKNMLHFYEETGDTSKYFMKAIAYYERYFMTVDPDSIKHTDSLRIASMRPQRDTLIKGNKATVSSTIVFRAYAQTFTTELNDGAQSFYKMTANPYLLSVATEWIKKGLEFFTTPEALDTYSHLLYKQGQAQKAMEVQAEVLALRKQRGYSIKEQELLIAKMKQGVRID